METVRAAPKDASAASGGNPPIASEELLVCTFNTIRDELVSTLVYVLGNREDAFDATQEAFLKCWRARASLTDVQNIRAWIFRVGLNAAKDYQRSAWKRRSRAIAGDETMIMGRDIGPGQPLEDQEDLELLRQAILGLREEEKEVFLLRQNGGLTYEQIAEIRSSPVGTVKTQMRSALQKLRQKLA
ncbi:RNA polymerase sigma factor [Telmatocola sphagniphila]|uniref:RNA polymerase sigma factor n=1 Tax=Telmatocola sphagniphila TaxID=1123043 RepID=A0A8E6B4T1_9BACT|nr:RNA polymerase sigma factor [Telmatocola sphagniphila]QVL30395.1 RNA polymerase sigma factor [Telmatocola sphagniphila]